MGFFSDLKDDLNQAATELIPGEEEANTEGASESKDFDLGALLDNIDEVKTESTETVADEKKTSSKVTDETALITSGMSVTGDINSSGSLDVLGSVTGNIVINGKLNIVGSVEGDSQASEIFADGAKIVGQIHSSGSVKVGQSTVIIGNITATSAVIAGAVKGDIDVKGPVVLDTSAIVMGNIKSKSVQINNGAVIEGICSQCYADVNPISFFDDFKKNKK